jgi:hypothetical protein
VPTSSASSSAVGLCATSPRTSFQSGCGLSTTIPHAGLGQQSNIQQLKNFVKKDSKELGKEHKQLLSLHPAREKKIVEKSEN